MSRIAKFILTAALALGFFAPAMPAAAASLTQSQIQAVTSLLVAFGVDNSTIANVQAALNGTTATTSSTAATASTTQSSAITANMIGYLRLGDEGANVRYLQVLLAADPSIYPQALISGYYGALTEAAVKRFQRKHHLEDVGFIGPQTLKNLESELEDHPFTAATSTPDQVCAIVPPGHLIAPGWLKHHEGEDHEIVPSCQTLPPGIEQDQEHEGENATPPGTTTPDVTAPVISSVSAGSIASTSAAVSWTTNEPATSKVYFGTTTPLNLGTALTASDSALATAHVLTLSPLTASSTYYYVVESADSSSNTATSSAGSFSTLAF